MIRHARGEQDPDEVFVEAEPPLEFPEPETVTTGKRRRRSLWVLLGALLALIGVVLVLYFSPLLTLRNIEYSGAELLPENRAEELLGGLRGTPLLQVGTDDVREALAEENVVADVSARAELPGTLHVDIEEHSPVAEVHEEEAVLFYSAEGEVIREFPGAEAIDAEGYATPEISAGPALEDEAVFAAVASALGQLPDSVRAELDSASAESVDSVTLQLQDGRTVLWGSGEHGGEKAVVLEAILASEDEDFTEVEVIDVSTPSTPVTR